jgi:hypothetical protein
LPGKTSYLAVACRGLKGDGVLARGLTHLQGRREQLLTDSAMLCTGTVLCRKSSDECSTH